MAEAILKHIAEQRGLPITTRSAGICAVLGARASENARLALAPFGIDLSGHRSTPLSPELVAWADVILVMSGDHCREIARFFPQATGKTQTLAGFCGEEGEIRDPYGGSAEQYARCAQKLALLLSRAADQLI